LKLKRIFMTIRRGITDATLLCVFPWEKPLVEEIHGGSAVVVSIDDMCSLDGVKNVKKIKLKERVDLNDEPMVPSIGMTMRQQYEKMIEIDPEENPLQDPEAEFGRMAEKYGMHPDIAVPVVEKVYGSARNFRQCLREFAAGTTPEFLRDDDESLIDAASEETPIAEMTATQMKATLDKRGVKYRANASKGDLEALLLNEPEEVAA